MRQRRNFRSRLRSGETLIGSFLFSREEAVVLAAESAGLDFVLLDFEHGVYSEESAARLAFCRLQDTVAVLVRCTLEQALLLGGLLDAGMDGLIVAGCKNRRDVERVVDAVRFAPLGRRGFHPAVPASRFGEMNSEEFMRVANESTTIMVLAESADLIEQLPNILNNQQVDGIFFGPYDLSVDLGIPGQVDDGAVQTMIDQSIREVKREGRGVGIFAANRDTAQGYVHRGANFVALGVDMVTLQASWKENVKSLR